LTSAVLACSDSFCSYYVPLLLPRHFLPGGGERRPSARNMPPDATARTALRPARPAPSSQSDAHPAG
jgi:hypothetical protein